MWSDMHSEVIQLNENKLQVTHKKLPWLPYCLILMGYFSGLFCAYFLAIDGWFIAVIIPTLAVLTLCSSEFASRFIKKEVFIIDTASKEIYKNGVLYKKFEDNIGTTIEEIPTDTSDYYLLTLTFPGGKLHLGGSSSRQMIEARQMQINHHIGLA